jgi:hypothetical protein
VKNPGGGADGAIWRRGRCRIAGWQISDGGVIS